MPLSLSKRASLIAQSEIRAMTIACAKIGGINLAQGVCDTEVPLPVRRGVQKGVEALIIFCYTLYVKIGYRTFISRIGHRLALIDNPLL